MVTELLYDVMGNATQSTDRGTDLTGPGVTERTTAMTYLAGSSDLQQVTDAENHVTKQIWSTTAPYRLIEVENAENNSVTYSYSIDSTQPGWISAITDANNNVTNYSYDARGNVTSISKDVPGKTLVQRMTYNLDGSVADVSEWVPPAWLGPLPSGVSASSAR